MCIYICVYIYSVCVSVYIYIYTHVHVLHMCIHIHIPMISPFCPRFTDLFHCYQGVGACMRPPPSCKEEGSSGILGRCMALGRMLGKGCRDFFLATSGGEHM